MRQTRVIRAFKSLAARTGRAAARHERLLIALAIGAIGLVFAGFLAIHLIVSTSVLRRWVNQDPQELLLDYDSASAWVPGLIRVRGLSVRGSDRNVQWFFRMEEATISISLPALLRREFHATRVRARGLVFRLREKEKKADLSPAHLSRLPSVPGFSDPPIKEETRGPTPPSESGRGYWAVRIESLTADPTTDIWIEIYRFQGQARVTGGFYLHPHDEAWIGPAGVRFLSGNVALAPSEPLLASASGQATCVIEPFQPDKVQGDEVWRLISGTIRLHGRLEDIRFLNHFLRRSKEPRLEGGAGTAQVSVRFARGIGQGRSDFEVKRVAVRYGKEALFGRASGSLEIPRWDVERDDMNLSGSHVSVDNIATAGTRRDERDWWGRFRIASGELRQGGLIARTAVHCRDARPLYTLLQADLPGWAQGILKLEGITATARVRLGDALVDVEGLEAEGGKFHIAGRYREKGKERTGAFLVETGPLAVGVSIDGSSSRVKLLGARKWFRESNAAPAAPVSSGADLSPRDSSGLP